jgi:TrmH family RNA methyltransferase
MTKIVRYKKELPFSYSLGASVTYEMLYHKPELCRQVIISGEYKDEQGKLTGLCRALRVPVIENNRALTMLSPKENCLVAGMFDKRKSELNAGGNHVVLVNPSDMGNIGTIVRICAAFGVDTLVTAGTTADLHHPKTIRASMGAYFHVDSAAYETFEQYRAEAGIRAYCPFMLDGATAVTECRPAQPWSLIFGNEASGLPDEYQQIGTPVYIPQTKAVDSLSLPSAVSIGVFMMTNGVPGVR